MNPCDVTAFRLRLLKLGYTPVPLYGKQPPIYGKNNSRKGLTGWQEMHTKVTPAEIGLWEKIWPDANNTGVLTRLTPAPDIDITDPEAAEAVEALVREHFEERGLILVRIGKAPKRATLLRTDEPFEKMVRIFTAPNGSEQKIEILGDGQQLVVAGIHPETQQPYSWQGGEPGSVARDDLPYVRADDMRVFLDAATALLVEHFAFKIKSKSNGHAKPRDGGEEESPFKRVGDQHQLEAPVGRVAAALAAIPNENVDWDAWNRVAMAAWRASNGAAFSAFDAWSQKSDKYDADVTAEKWEKLSRSPPTSIGFGTLKYLADQAAPRWEDDEGQPQAGDSADEPTNDSTTPDANVAPTFSEEWLALLFAKCRARGLRYVAAFGQWFMWNGSRWEVDHTRKTFSLARNLCRQTALMLDKPGARSAMASARTRAAVVSLAGEDRRLAATTDQWDTDPWLLNTPNGVVDLHTGQLRPHKPEDYMTKQTAVSPGGDCPLWKKFMGEITGGDVELQRYLQRISGYSLTGVTYEQELFFFYGEGNNGKGVWVLTVSGIIKDYHVATSIETFTVSNSERHPTELARLWGARLVTAAETEEGKRWAEARIKEMTGGDKITARFMRQDFFEFIPQFKLLFSGNHMPTLRSVNKAITRRFNRIPFAVTIPDHEVDTHLAEKLKAEWPGILQWMIDGCLEWQRIGLAPPAAVTEATKKYLEGEDVLGAWLDECCQLDANGWENSTALFKSWQPWAEERQEWIGSVRTLSSKLEDRGFAKHKNAEKTERGFRGLRLKVNPEAATSKKAPAHEKVLFLYVRNETYGEGTHQGAILVTLKPEDEPSIWLPKSQIERGEAKPDGREEITMPMWLAKKNGWEDAESHPDPEPRKCKFPEPKF